MFLDINDYPPFITTTVLNQITQGDDNNRTKTEVIAQNTMEDYMRTRYDVGAIFAQTGLARHKTVVLHMISITLYHLHTAVTPNAVPESRTDRYNQAMAWLKDLANGKISPDLPRLEDEGGVVKSRSYFSSRKPREDFDY